MRRRGSRGRDRAAGGRGFEKLAELRALGLRDLQSLESPEGSPDEIELATAVHGDQSNVVIVASPRDGLDLLGWGRVARVLAGRRGAEEIWIAAPAFSGATRRAAQAEADRGLQLRLIAAPLLAPEPEEVVAVDSLSTARGAWDPAAGAVLARVAQVAEGAAAITGAGALRRVVNGYVMYLRGVRVVAIALEGDGVSVSFLEPERRHIHVTEGNFPRWGLELHESVVQLAQDPRLLGRPEELAQRAAERAAGAADVRIDARWIPWNADGTNPVDWVGVDAEGEIVLGFVRSSVGLADVPGIVAGIAVVQADRENLVPGGRGGLRVVLSTEQLEGRARQLLEELEIPVETRTLDAPAERPADAGERKGRRRTRRRRGRRDEPVGRDAAEAPAEEELQVERPAEEAEPARESSRGRGRFRGRRRGGRGGDRGRSEERDAEETRADSRLAEDETGEIRETREEPRPESKEREPRELEPTARADSAQDREAEPATEPGAEPETEPDEREEVLGEGAVAAATGTDEDSSEEAEETPAEEPRELPRRKRARAAICVRNDSDTILAALVLARERRHIPFFYVCPQEDLMDFFRGKATDLDENSDLLLVGFTAEPVPREVISAAELFRGRVQWFDGHDWPIEDVEALRDAIGRDSIVLSDKPSGPLVPVMDMTERRSRFTDKLVELYSRRMSENDMKKWGYNLIGLIHKMSATPGDYRSSISPVLAGKPAELPEVEAVYHEEATWLDEHDARMVHFGEYQMAVVSVPAHLDAGEVARRARLQTGARLSLAAREGDPLLMLGANEEKRHVNLTGVMEKLDTSIHWAHAQPGGDRIGRIRVDALQDHPERLDALIGEIVRHRSVLYG